MGGLGVTAPAQQLGLFHHCPCPPARDLGIRVSGLVYLSLYRRSYLRSRNFYLSSSICLPFLLYLPTFPPISSYLSFYILQPFFLKFSTFLASFLPFCLFTFQSLPSYLPILSFCLLLLSFCLSSYLSIFVPSDPSA